MIILITFLLVYLGWMDYALTSVILSLGGAELNPLLIPIVDTPYFFYAKVGFPLLFGLLLHLTRSTHGLSLAVFGKSKRSKFILTTICFVILVYFAVMAWATFDLYRHLVQ